MVLVMLNRSDVDGRLLPMACLLLAAFLAALFLSPRNLYATDHNDCLLEALTTAPDNMTVGQLREQCRQGEEKNPPAGKDFSAANGSDGPPEIILKTPQAKKPAFFPHKKHQEKYTCGLCHHGKDASGALAKFTETTVIAKCTDCHNPEMANQELNGFQGIGHKLCRECHRTNQDITSATCTTCHRKDL